MTRSDGAQTNRVDKLRTLASDYLTRGWAVVRYAAGSKAPSERNWQRHPLTTEQVAALDEDDNLGVLTGQASGGLYDLDLDAPEAIQAAMTWAPPTARIHGRASKPHSHYWYSCPDTPGVTTKRYQFAEASIDHNTNDSITYVEVRGGNGEHAFQTMAPPSLHPNGEVVTWERDGEPGTITYDDLVWAAARIATATLIARHWPAQGLRDEAAMALAGGLIRGTDWSDAQIDEFTTMVASLADDEEHQKRQKASATRDKLDHQQEVTGWPALAERLVDGERVVKTIWKWLGIRTSSDKQKPASVRDQALAVLEPAFAQAGSQDASYDESQDSGESGPIPDYAVAERFHDASGEVYATIPVADHHETYRIKSERLRRWIRYQAYTLSGLTLSTQDVTEILELWAARALFDGPVREVAQRVWQPDDTTVWLDLGDDTHQAVKITPDGWYLYSNPPVKFIRKKGSLPLPTPILPLLPGKTSGQILEELLRPYTNIAPPRQPDGTEQAIDHDWVVVIAWLLAALRLRGPFAVLQLKGEKGTAKSTLARVLRRLVDPHQVALEPQPGGLRDMAIAAQGSWVLAYDNLSHLTTAMSNALCMMATGGGYRTRALYTDDEEAIFSYMRPVLLTGIAEVVVKPDLLDRTITVTLPVIPKRSRRAEERFWRDFDAQHPAILGALLAVLSQTLGALPTIADQEWPRMADFARFACAVEVAMGWPTGAFMDALAAVENESAQTALEGSPIAQLLLDYLNEQRRKSDWYDKAGRVLWRGTMATLLSALKKRLFDYENDAHPERSRPGWPKGPRALTSLVIEITPHLRAMGLDIRRATRHGARDYEVVDTREDAEIPPESPRSVSHGLSY